MATMGTGDCSERGNKDCTEISVKSSIMKMIDDLERELQRIEGKIADICGGEEQGGAEKDRSKRYFVEDKKTVSKEAELNEALGEVDIDGSGLKPSPVVEVDEIEDTASQRSDADTDEDDWECFIAERAAIPVKESNIDLSASEAKADSPDDTEDDWDDFCRERANMTVVDISDDTGDDFDEFFSERTTVDKYKTKPSRSKGKLRRLIRRIFGRH